MMKLYWFPRTRSSRVVWMLEETGVEYERVFIDVLIMETLGVLPSFPRLQRYAERCRERPCCQAAEALEFASRNRGGGLMPRSQLRRGGPRRDT